MRLTWHKPSYLPKWISVYKALQRNIGAVMKNCYGMTLYPLSLWSWVLAVQGLRRNGGVKYFISLWTSTRIGWLCLLGREGMSSDYGSDCRLKFGLPEHIYECMWKWKWCKLRGPGKVSKIWRGWQIRVKAWWVEKEEHRSRVVQRLRDGSWRWWWECNILGTWMDEASPTGMNFLLNVEWGNFKRQR